MSNPNTGRFTWHELMTADPAAAAKFYGELLGWKVQEMDMGPGGTYRLFLNGDKQVGGAMKAPPGVPAHWLPYVDTVSVDETAKKLVEHGGKVMVPPTDVPGIVRFCVAADPQGAAIGFIHNISDRAPEALPEVPPPGAFCWDELHTKDLDAAAKHYAAVFGWGGKLGEGPMQYFHWSHAGKDIGGMMTLQAPGIPPNWLSYIAVADVDAKVGKLKELGGKVLMGPMEVEKVGRFAIVQDPGGAAFALFRSARV
jgi:predicted enzyme related to lactoylglutathione lyase